MAMFVLDLGKAHTFVDREFANKLMDAVELGYDGDAQKLCEANPGRIKRLIERGILRKWDDKAESCVWE